MLRLLSVTVCTIVLSGSTIEDGQGWLKKAEDQLYRWPEPRPLVRFEAHTDLLAPLIASMKRDLEQKPDPEAARFVAALDKLELRGSIDTATGKLETDIKIAFETSDTRTAQALLSIRQRVQSTLAGCFASLPLADPALLRKGARVSSAEARRDELLVTSAGSQPGQATVLHFARDTGLPKQIELPQMTLALAYTEATHGRFVPASIELQPAGGKATHAEFSWQHEGDVWFPEHVKLTSKTADAKLDFDYNTMDVIKKHLYSALVELRERTIDNLRLLGNQVDNNDRSE